MRRNLYGPLESRGQSAELEQLVDAPASPASQLVQRSYDTMLREA